MFPPLNNYAQSRSSDQFSTPANHSNASGQSYERRGLPVSAYSPYGQLHTASEFGLTTLRKPRPGEFSYSRNPPTNAPLISQQTLPVQQNVEAPNCPSGTRLGEFAQEAFAVPSVVVNAPSRHQISEPFNQMANAPSSQPTALSTSAPIAEGALSELDRTRLISTLPTGRIRRLVKSLYDGNLRCVLLY
jgi:hypothetical protein